MAARALAAPVTTALDYQGQLKQDGVPFNGTLNLRFSLWDAAGAGVPPIGGNQIGDSQLFLDHPVTDGLFDADLNAGGQFGDSAFDGQARWLQLEICGDPACKVRTVLGPRQAVNAVPYALYSLSGPGAVGTWQTSGSDIFNTNAGNVGIGTPAPNHRLRIAGGAPWTTHYWSGALELDYASAIGWRKGPDGRSFGIGETSGVGSGGLYFFHTSSDPGSTASIPNYDLSITPGRLGVNTITPTYPLTVYTPPGYGLVHTDGVREVGTYVDAQGGWLGTRSNHPLHLFANDSIPRITVNTDGSIRMQTGLGGFPDYIVRESMILGDGRVSIVDSEKGANFYVGYSACLNLGSPEACPDGGDDTENGGHLALQR